MRASTVSPTEAGANAASPDYRASPIERHVGDSTGATMKTTLKPDDGLDTMISHLRHELRSPVAAALVHLAVLERGLSSMEGAGKLLGNLEHARRGLSSLDRLVNRTLEAYHRGAISLHREQVDVEHLIGEVLDRVGTDNPTAAAQIEYSLPPGMVAHLDPTVLEEIVANLLSNALKCGEGKPTRLGDERAPGGVRLLVRDLGSGLPLDGKKAIFSVPPRTSGRSVPGLGLWIVGKMVEAHGGRISVDCPPEGGTLFDVFLPE
jgi:K+-sensing histidine kinase KdpD